MWPNYPELMTWNEVRHSHLYMLLDMIQVYHWESTYVRDVTP